MAWKGTFAVRFLPENLGPAHVACVFWGPFATKMPPTATGRYHRQPPSAAATLDPPSERRPTWPHPLLPLQPLAIRPPLLIPLEASLAKINNDLIVAKFNGHFSVLLVPNSSAGFDMVDHSFALESFSSLSFYDNTLWGFPPPWALLFRLFVVAPPAPAPAPPRPRPPPPPSLLSTLQSPDH